ncbi:hypothetical protein [Parasitella parasitica]|uniref:RRM Nup35-type domain-containing protein n=1 Tax=Parasitella parasitica TaxID=35722 RepID=A0A0B7N7H7_9FUNG|nr:hypothetical protein [Parasitella parasitica]
MATNALFQTNTEPSSKSSLLQPPKLESINSFLATNDSNAADSSTEPTSIFSTIPTQKKDLTTIPPVFFVGGSENALILDEPMEEAKDQSNLSIGYGDRRLSGVLSEKPDDTKLETSSKQDQSSKKRIFLGAADAQRGLFGNGDVQKKRRGSLSIPQEEKSSSTQISDSQSKSIRVFGYPANLVNNVVSHFNRYGKIEKYQQAPGGNWITITYEKNASALAALKSNGVVISKNHLIGVTLEELPTHPVAQNVVPLMDSNGVFKANMSNTTFSSGLGKGKVGVSALDGSNVGTESIESGFFSRLKDAFLGW